MVCFNVIIEGWFWNETLEGEGYCEYILLFCICILKGNFYNVYDVLSEERSL